MDDVYDAGGGGAVHPAPWVTNASATPAARIYGLGNGRGFCCSYWNANWPALHMAGWVDVDRQRAADWAGNMLCTHRDDGHDGHGSVLVDVGNYSQAWTYMLTRAGRAHGRGKRPGLPRGSAELGGCACT